MTYFKSRSGYARPMVKPAPDRLMMDKLLGLWNGCESEQQEAYAEAHGYYHDSKHDTDLAAKSVRRRLNTLAKQNDLPYDATAALAIAKVIVKGIEADIANGVEPVVPAASMAGQVATEAFAAYAREWITDNDDDMKVRVVLALDALRVAGKEARAADILFRYMSQCSIPLHFMLHDDENEMPRGTQGMAARLLVAEMFAAGKAETPKPIAAPTEHVERIIHDSYDPLKDPESTEFHEQRMAMASYAYEDDEGQDDADTLAYRADQARLAGLE